DESPARMPGVEFLRTRRGGGPACLCGLGISVEPEQPAVGAHERPHRAGEPELVPEPTGLCLGGSVVGFSRTAIPSMIQQLDRPHRPVTIGAGVPGFHLALLPAPGSLSCEETTCVPGKVRRAPATPEGHPADLPLRIRAPAATMAAGERSVPF